MDNDDFLAIEDSLRRFAAALGVPELTADRYYRFRDRQQPDAHSEKIFEYSEEDPAGLLPPRERVLAQLAALDRLLSVRDRSSYLEAMAKITGLLGEAAGDERRERVIPERAVVALESRGGGEGALFDLGALPDLGEVREGLRRLRARLAEA